ncbi:MAG: PKD domain-containing protein [Prevotella sp.]|jgi:hypothetical protein|nr:PKD domain-containing protein [Prevotella sp.]
MKNIVLISKSILLIFISLIISSCSEDEPVQIALYLPVANFSYEAFDKKVVFTDKSENADSYYWTFGDGETSTEQNPTHFFKASKRYSVELTIRGEKGKTSSKKMTVDLSDGSTTDPEDVNITIDGDFSDWQAVPSSMLATSSIASYVTDLVALKQVQLCGNDNYVFFYLKADAAKFNVVQFYIDKDNYNETGFLGWYWSGIGSEFLLEASREDNLAPTVMEYDDANGNGGTGWNWITLFDPAAKAIEISQFVAGENNIVEVEGRIIRSYVPELGRTVKMGVALVDASWAASGLLPSKLEDGGLNSAITVKLP